MIIGNFKKVGGDYAGKIETLLFTTQAALQALGSKRSDKSLDFRVLAGEREIGVAWKKTTREGKPYLSVLIEDPGIYITCVLFETEAGHHILIWNRERN